MSAVRRSGRSGARPSPYARPPSKKSSWSISGILSYLNPLKPRAQEEVLPVAEDTDESDYNAEELGRTPAQALSTRGHQLSRSLKSKGTENETPPRPTRQAPPDITLPHQPVQQHSPGNPFIEPTSPEEGIQIVTSFLDAHRDQHISNIEAEGLISLLKKSSAETREPFRFSSSPSTPQRGNSPLYASASTTSLPFRFSTPTETPNQSSNSSEPKLLKHNPNGKYRWQGGGSAKARSRNRYQSPAFGTSRASSERLVLKESPEKIKTDTKRRRVGDEAESTTASPSGSTSTPPPMTRSPAPAPSPTRTVQAPPFPNSNPNGVPSSSGKANGTTNNISSSRLRLSAVQKPTTPVVPSPLRQAWGQSSPSNSDSEGGSPVPAPKQTKAANFMSELITQVTTTKHFEVSNPYQAASPVKTTGQAKPRSKRIRAGKTVSKIDVNGAESESGNEKEKEKDKKVEKQYSAQAIIEATLPKTYEQPKGSTRSRPPPNLGNGPANGSSRTSTSRSPPPASSNGNEVKRTRSYVATVEEVEDEDETDRSPKKAKPNGQPVNGFTAKPAKSAPIIEELPENDLSSGKTAIRPSEIIEPGAQEKTSSILGSGPSSTSGSKSSLHVFGLPKSNNAPKEPSKLRQSFKLDTPTPSAAPSSTASTTPSPFFPATAAAPAQPAAATTTSSSLPTPSALSKADAKQAALNMPVPSLPTFTFAVATTVSLDDKDAMTQAKSTPLSKLPKFDFTIPASSSTTSEKPPEPAPTPVEKPAEPPARTESKPVVQAFDWSASGFKMPDKQARSCYNIDVISGTY
ncbi:hypothetical protein V5O48_004462 [Marasmius crinis-equi]|uniref:Uncharacterized protein n=1 Tax=Marasmius crinis-equi TaxID=585013 RepID=A0ABR3FQ18_9AGAR